MNINANIPNVPKFLIVNLLIPLFDTAAGAGAGTGTGTGAGAGVGTGSAVAALTD